MERLSLHPFCSALNDKMRTLWNIKLNSAGKLFLERDGLVHLDPCQLCKHPIIWLVISWFCKPHTGSLCCTCLRHRAPWKYRLSQMPFWVASACCLHIGAFEAAHFAVTMTTLVGSQPSEAQFSKRKKGWLTSLTKWQPAEKMVCWLNNHSVFFLGSSNYVNSETVSINCPIRHLVIMPLQKYPESWWQGLGALFYCITNKNPI